MERNGIGARRGRLGRRLSAMGAASALALALAAGCTATSERQSGSGDGAQDQAQAVLRADIEAMDLELSDRDRDGSYDEAAATKVDLAAGTVSGSGAAFQEGRLVVSEEGTYVLSGGFEGMVQVAASKEAKLQLVLDGAQVTASGEPALYVESADKVFVTLAEGSQNLLEGGQADEGDEALNAAVYSKEDLTFNGAGTLAVSAQAEGAHGILSKDDLVIAEGSYGVRAANDGLRGKDCVKVAGGTLAIEAGSDCVKSTNDEDAARGFVSIEGGELTLKAGDDGLDATHYLRVAGGDLAIEAQDDALHCDSDGLVAGGELALTAGDDAIHCDYALTVEGGTVSVAECEEGYEAQEITINGGTGTITARDDALNASEAEGSGDGSASQGQPVAEGGNASGDPAPDGPMGGSSACSLTINGGELTVYAGGDGLDSNGSLTVNGGMVLVSGPADGGNGAIDYETTGTINGGTVVAAGPAGMAMGFSEGTQASALAQFQGQAGQELRLLGPDGTVLASLTPANAYQTVVVSSPELSVGDTATLASGNQSVQVTMAENSASAFGGAPGQGGFGRDEGERSQGFGGQRPEGGPGSDGAAPPDGASGQAPSPGRPSDSAR